jgi:hypothetical protein
MSNKDESIKERCSSGTTREEAKQMKARVSQAIFTAGKNAVRAILELEI